MAKKLIYADSTGSEIELTSTGGGSSSEPTEYLKKAEVSDSTLTLTKKDNTTVVYTPTTKLDKAIPTTEQGTKEYLYTFAGTTQNTDVALVNDMSGDVASYTDRMVPTALSVKQITKDMTGATTTTAGEHGLVPAPTTNDSKKYLRGDGTWADDRLLEVETMPDVASGTIGDLVVYKGTDETTYKAGMIYKLSSSGSYWQVIWMSFDAGDYVTNYAKVDCRVTSTTLYEDTACTVATDYTATTHGDVNNSAGDPSGSYLTTDVYEHSGSRAWVIVSDTRYLPLSGGIMSGNINMASAYKITNVVDPTDATDVANKQYSDKHALQLSDMSTPSAYYNKIIQYTGSTTPEYTKGYFYTSGDWEYYDIQWSISGSEPWTHVYSTVEPPAAEAIITYTDIACTTKSGYTASATEIYQESSGLKVADVNDINYVSSYTWVEVPLGETILAGSGLVKAATTIDHAASITSYSDLKSGKMKFNTTGHIIEFEEHDYLRQEETMPTPTSVGEVVQYIGSSTTSYTQGHIYVSSAVSDTWAVDASISGITIHYYAKADPRVTPDTPLYTDKACTAVTIYVADSTNVYDSQTWDIVGTVITIDELPLWKDTVELSGYLPLSGGTMTGCIQIPGFGIQTIDTNGWYLDATGNFHHRSNNSGGLGIYDSNNILNAQVDYTTGSISTRGSISRMSDSDYLMIYGGSDTNTCSSIKLYAKDNDNFGVFQIQAKTASESSALIGKPDGTLTWGGNNVITAAGGTMTGNLIMSNSATVTGVPTPSNDSDAANKAYVDKRLEQVETMPAASSVDVGTIVQYVGTDETTYKTGFNYKATTYSYYWFRCNRVYTPTGLYSYYAKEYPTSGEVTLYTDSTCTIEAGYTTDGSSIFNTAGQNHGDVSTYQQLTSSIWKAIDMISTEYLPLSGGTLTGQVTLSYDGYKSYQTSGLIMDCWGNIRHQNSDTNSLWNIYNGDGDVMVQVGWENGVITHCVDDIALRQNGDLTSLHLVGGSDATSAELSLMGKSHSNKPGYFQLSANDGTNQSILVGQPDGTFTWGGKPITITNQNSAIHGTRSTEYVQAGCDNTAYYQLGDLVVVSVNFKAYIDIPSGTAFYTDLPTAASDAGGWGWRGIIACNGTAYDLKICADTQDLVSETALTGSNWYIGFIVYKCTI